MRRYDRGTLLAENVLRVEEKDLQRRGEKKAARKSKAPREQEVRLVSAPPAPRISSHRNRRGRTDTIMEIIGGLTG